MLQFKKEGDILAFFNEPGQVIPLNLFTSIAEKYETTQVKRNQIIYFQDSDADYFYYLVKGRVKSYISSEDGSEKVLAVYQPGNIFGEAAFFGDMPRVSSAVALVDSEIIRVNKQMAAAEMAENPAFATSLLKYLGRTVQLLSVHVDEMAFMQVDQRIARYLISLPKHENFTVKCTQDEIATSVSANRVTVSRILKSFETQGVLKTHYGSIQILNIEGLARIASQ